MTIIGSIIANIFDLLPHLVLFLQIFFEVLHLLAQQLIHLELLLYDDF